MIQTRVLSVDIASPDSAILDEAAHILARGGLVAFPTETVYGLGADATLESAVRAVFAAKGRPADNPLIVHLADAAEMSSVAIDIPPLAHTMAAAFWPGPLTLVLKGKTHLPLEVTAGLDTVAVRVPDHAVPRELVRRLGRGIVGPSANSSGRPSPTTAEHVLADLNGLVDLILDSGPTRIGVESTVVDVTCNPPKILRQGGLTQELIEAAIGPLAEKYDPEDLRRSPGTRYRHYAPRARVILVQTGDSGGAHTAVAECKSTGRRVGVIIHSIVMLDGVADVILRVSSDPADYAHQFYASLRDMDNAGMECVIVEEIEESGLGRTLRDRMRRAAE